ncbi:5-formyltetrahydrofolate cyclo-ligase [Janthinobacterium agaricidamnosum NBRC 102515 = DSM 9628]|uniref:5-formyltetrahydrofolate cyclo-ligase n=1 Tax=Janthinobacterium agaricidamnosum NBRC 102515 = DSM 9628 TaxID=1349767 RepID=W0VD92_9BURK|nr:5-formyltetrahydrofolate cyclo-ligase [Janthinobacterium agaricidamnosum NBRC 102515 = DSM 9628]
MNVPNPKTLLRKSLLNMRRALADDVRAGWDSHISDHVSAWCRQHAIRALGVYWPLHGEPDLHGLYALLAARGVTLYLPVVLEKHAPLAFSEWTPGVAMVKDGMGVAVPQDLRLQACPPAILVPCLGFNAQRLRLGYGGGFYDRTLARRPRPRTLGVAYACLAAAFTGGVHDIALDDIVTEGGLL